MNSKPIRVTRETVKSVNDLKFGVVYETLDYEMFKDFEGNRRNVKKITTGSRFSITAADIKKNGQKRPAAVTSDLAVFKGQNRLAVAKKLGTPFVFIRYDITIAEAMEEIRESWTESSGKAIDYAYLNSLDETKDQRGYKNILVLIDTYKIPLSYIPQVVSVTTGVQVQPDSYEFRFVRQENFDIDKVVSDAEELIQVLKMKKFDSQRAVINVFEWLYRNKGVDEAKKVFKKVRGRAARLTKNKVPTPSTISVISEWAEIDLPARLQNK